MATTDDSSGAQGYEEFEVPEREEIYRVSRTHIGMMESATSAEWVFAGMEHIVLRTIGRRSGKEHKVALPKWVDDGGNIVVVASNAGAPAHPAWFFNLSDRDANPDVLVKTSAGEFRSVPQVLEGDEHDRIWAALTTDRPFYADYAVMAGRTIPLVRLPR
ncbi:MAG: nitroreductase/quinone reductase family protein [Acidimicrobiia bacterium]